MNNAVKVGIVAVATTVAGVVGGFIWGRKTPSAFDEFMEGALYHEAKSATEITSAVINDDDRDSFAKQESLQWIYSKEYIAYLKDMIDTNIGMLESFVQNEDRLKKLANKRPVEVKYFRTKLEAYCALGGKNKAKVQAILDRFIIGL